MRKPLLVIVACTAVLLGGLALVGLPGIVGGMGIGLVVVGLLGLGAFLVFAEVKAARNGVGDAYNPGRAWRDTRAENSKAKDRRR